jgi:uncharacterized protein YoxC
MTPFASAAVHFSVRAASAVADTIWVQQATTHQGLIEKITSIAGVVMTLALLAIAIALVPAAWNFRKTYKKTLALLDKVEADIAPLIKHAHAIADNVNYVSTAIRADVGQIHGTLTDANRRLQEAVALTERRMHDFSALLAVVQQEAEGIFVSTAATVHGVRTGASHLAGGDGPELASVEVDDDGLEAAVNDEESDDGTDFIRGIDPDADHDADATRAPRIIRRTRTRQ